MLQRNTVASRADILPSKSSMMMVQENSREIGPSDIHNVVLLDTEQTRDVQNNLKKRRIEVYFRNRVISIGNNVY